MKSGAMINDYGINGLVHLRREVEGSEKESVLIGSDVFIQTSRFEGMPMGILEAMSYGIPVLITEGTTLGEYVKEYNGGGGCGYHLPINSETN